MVYRDIIYLDWEPSTTIYGHCCKPIGEYNGCCILMYGHSAQRDPWVMVKWSHPRVFGKIKLKLLLSKNITNMGIARKLVNNNNN